MKGGNFVISLDFELAWGSWLDEAQQKGYQNRIQGARKVIPEILKLFKEYEIHATWAAVGMLFFKSKNELLNTIPAIKPAYLNPDLSVYNHLKDITGDDERTDPLHFAPSLIKEIRNCPFQEIASHTFSHYYCLEKGQTEEHFRGDLSAFAKVAESYGLYVTSIVYPMNQANPAYFDACAEYGIKAYRGNPKNAIFDSSVNSFYRRALRLLDAYLNITGFHSYDINEEQEEAMVNIPSSRFLRPYTPRLSAFEPLKYNRICREMSYAAKHAQTYHLWWHPYNFGIHRKQNLRMLRVILAYYSGLREKFGMKSLTMEECCDLFLKRRRHGK